MKIRVASLALVLFASCKSAPTPEPTTAAPAPKEEVQAPAETWRESPPKAGPSPDLTLPSFEKAQLKNGLTVMVSENRSLPIVAFIVVSRGGAALDPPGRAGTTALAYQLIGEGAGKRDALEFSDAVADLGANFGTSADQDTGFVSISGLSRTKEDMLSLLSDAVQRPRLAKKDFERIKTQALANIVSRRGSPQGLAFEYVPSMVYGAKHPYGHPVSGTEKTVKSVQLRDVQRRARASLRPGQSAFIAAGDINLEEAKALAEKHFGGWGGRGDSAKDFAAVKAKPRTKLVVVHKDNAPQTMVVLGRPIFGRGNPEETALVVANEIYGGSFASRLNLKLREEKEYTYGAHSALSLRRGVGAFLAYSAIQQEYTAPALKEFFDLLTGMRSEPPKQAELDRAKAGLIRSLPGDFERQSAVAGAAVAIFIYDLPLDHYAKKPDRLAQVDLTAVEGAAKSYLTPPTTQVLLVGDSKKIVPALQKLGLGEVQVIMPR